MGLVLDSSVLIAAERERQSVSNLLSSLETSHFETQFILSAITAMELEHGWHRATTPEIALKRRRFIDEILAVIPVESFTCEMSVMAARIDASMRKKGQVIATADLLIGATAVYFDYAVATRNLRHFQMFPGLKVVAL